jgi:hypothetical protein
MSNPYSDTINALIVAVDKTSDSVTELRSGSTAPLAYTNAEAAITAIQDFISKERLVKQTPEWNIIRDTFATELVSVRRADTLIRAFATAYGFSVPAPI